MAKRVITFGEIMMRLNPIGYLRLVQSDRFEATYAGGEANVAVSLANYGLDAAYVTKVPAHEVGQCAVNELRRYGVDTQYMVRGGDRLGIYFCEKGASQRASKVIYDRASSAIALAKRTDFDWDTIFDGADWFHWTGITPALGPYPPAPRFHPRRRTARNLSGRLQGGQGARSDHFLRSQLPQKALDEPARRRGHEPAAALC